MRGHPDKKSYLIRVMGLQFTPRNHSAVKGFVGSPRRSFGHLFVAVFFGVTHDINERGTTHSLTSSNIVT